MQVNSLWVGACGLDEGHLRERGGTELGFISLTNNRELAYATAREQWHLLEAAKLRRETGSGKQSGNGAAVRESLSDTLRGSIPASSEGVSAGNSILTLESVDATQLDTTSFDAAAQATVVSKTIVDAPIGSKHKAADDAMDALDEVLTRYDHTGPGIAHSYITQQVPSPPPPLLLFHLAKLRENEVRHFGIRLFGVRHL